jgi:hypothetical protein
MGFTLFGEKYKYEVDSINIGIFLSRWDIINSFKT